MARSTIYSLPLMAMAKTVGVLFTSTPRLACKASLLRALITPVGWPDHSGNLFVATATFDGSAYHGAIVKITPDGVQSTFATLSEQNFEPEGVAFDLAGN